MSLAELRDTVGSPGDRTESSARYLSWPQLVRRRFQRHPLALLGALLVTLSILLTLLGPSLAPATSPILTFGTVTPAQSVEATHIETPPQVWPPSWRYLLGTDENADPVVRHVLLGGRTPLAIGFLGALLAAMIGIVVGGISGFAGGWIDTLAMRTVDTFLAMPFVPLVLLLTEGLQVQLTPAIISNVIASDTLSYAVLFGLLGWPATARLIRGYVLSMRNWEFVEAARSLGVPESSIVFRHILPNVLGVMVVSLTLNVAVFIGTEVTIEFLGALVLDPDTWGKAMKDGFNLLLGGAWWVVLFPALAALVPILGVNLLGDGLRDAIDSLESGGTTRPNALSTSSAARVSRVGSGWAVAARGRMERIGHTGSAALRWIATPIRARLRFLAVPAPAGWGAVRVVDRWLAQPHSRRLTLGPPILVLAAGSGAFLFGQAPRTYAPHFAAPAQYGDVQSFADYDAVTRPRGGWSILAVRPSGGLGYSEVDGDGRASPVLALAPAGAQPAAPVLARSGRRTLGVWVESGQQQTLRAAYLPGTRASGFSIASMEVIEHPSIVPTPGGGFDVLFGGLRAQHYSLYLASIPSGSRRVVSTRILVRPHAHAIFPHAVVDGSGALDVVYLNLCCSQSIWNVQFQRFTLGGHPLARPRMLTQITTLFHVGDISAEVPAEWGVATARAADGSVWISGIGDDGIAVSHLSRGGRMLLAPESLGCVGYCPFADKASLAVVPVHGGAFFFYLNNSPSIGAHPYSSIMAPSGRILHTERVSYDFGGRVRAVHAGLRGVVPAVLWEKALYNGQTVLEGTTYHADVRPTVAERLGLNIGPIWANLAIVMLGSLTAGIPLTAINIFLIAILMLCWTVISRFLGGWTRWPVYFVALAAILVWAFAIRSTAPAFVLLLPAWTSPYGWIAVCLALSVSAWAGFLLAHHQDAWFRALSMALLAVYCLAVVSALVGIQLELAQI